MVGRTVDPREPAVHENVVGYLGVVKELERGPARRNRDVLVLDEVEARTGASGDVKVDRRRREASVRERRASGSRLLTKG